MDTKKERTDKDRHSTPHAEAMGSWLTQLLTTWGMPTNWAKLLTGALLGVAATLWALSCSNCELAAYRSSTTALHANYDDSLSLSWTQSQTLPAAPVKPTSEIITVTQEGK